MKKLILLFILLLSGWILFGQSTDAALTTQSNVIRDETAAGGNTKTRIAAMFQALIDSKVSIQAPRFMTSSTDGYVWTAVGTTGLGNWAAPSGGGGVTFDNTPTQGSSNAVTSDGIYQVDKTKLERGLIIITVTDADYTLTAGVFDAATEIHMSSSSAHNFIVPHGLSISGSLIRSVNIRQDGTARFTVTTSGSPTPTVISSSGSMLSLNQGQSISLTYEGTADSYHVYNGGPSAQVNDSDVVFTDITTGNVTSTKHGYTPKAPADATKFLNGAATAAYAQVKDSDLNVSDVTTNNITSSAHGFTPKSPADATKFLNGAATAAFAQVKDSDLIFTDITTNNASTSAHGFVKKLPNDATKYYDGSGNYSTPTVSSGYAKSGTYIINSDYALAASTCAMTANQIKAWPFIIRKNVVITEIITEVTVLAAATTYRIGIYADDGTVYPGTLVTGSDVGTYDSSTTGSKSSGAVSLTMNAGLYWLVVNSNGTATMRGIATGGLLTIMGSPDGLNPPNTRYIATLTYAALPSTFTAGATAAGNVTAIMSGLKVQ